MGKVYRQDRKTVQRIKARDIVPGDIVEVAGKLTCICNAFIRVVWEKIDLALTDLSLIKEASGHHMNMIEINLEIHRKLEI